MLRDYVKPDKKIRQLYFKWSIFGIFQAEFGKNNFF
jgi:hypothetical protein